MLSDVSSRVNRFTYFHHFLTASQTRSTHGRLMEINPSGIAQRYFDANQVNYDLHDRGLVSNLVYFSYVAHTCPGALPGNLCDISPNANASRASAEDPFLLKINSGKPGTRVAAWFGTRERIRLPSLPGRRSFKYRSGVVVPNIRPHVHSNVGFTTCHLPPMRLRNS